MGMGLIKIMTSLFELFEKSAKREYPKGINYTSNKMNAFFHVILLWFFCKYVLKFISI